jgi:adenine-specific DNA-methyltransferase
MIKYIGSKRRLVPVLTRICQASGATTALDLFTGTTRVAQAFKAQGVHVTAVDSARYAHTFARTYIETDAAATDMAALRAAVSHLNALPGTPGYVTETFSQQARFFQPHNAARIDAVRDAIDAEYAGSPLFPLLLTSLIEAADRVDSTTGVQMAYVKQWAPRSAKPLELRVPELLDGPGRAIRGDAVELTSAVGATSGLGHFDLAYLDPPYNQHRYFTNYHVWETMVAWDAPEAYGVARKRLDSRDPSTRSAFNSKRTMPAALASVVQSVDCDLLVLSYNNESWLAMDELEAMCAGRGAVATLAFDSARYVGARIGIFDPSGRKVGRVGHLSNQELVVIAGEGPLVRRVVEAADAGPTDGPTARPTAGPAARPAAAPVTGAAAEVVAAGRMDRLQQAT